MGEFDKLIYENCRTNLNDLIYNSLYLKKLNLDSYYELHNLVLLDLSDELKQGKSYSQIAEQLDVSLSTVKKRCERLNIDNLNKFRKNY
jgi:DNA invertase Pin-like site-specific DNA recombinase